MHLNKQILYCSFTLVLILSLFGCKARQNEELDKSEQSEALSKPNIIFIISDDQTFSDYSFMGHEHIETPHIDQLASESITFTRGYVTAPLCSPSLASIITGLYAQQHGITGNDPVVEYEGDKNYGREAPDGKYLENSYPVQRSKAYQKLSTKFYKNKLITQTLRENGYRSFQTGKWWVGSAEDAGFDEGMTHGDIHRGARHGDEGLKIGREGLEPIFNFIEDAESKDKPFFIWHAPFLPHTPHNPPATLEEKYLEVAPSPYIAKYWAMVEWFDQTTGELLDYLKTKGLEENTIIVYTSDNGWIQSIDARGYAPRSKRAPHEGGIRTPIMFKYPGKIKPAIDRENLVSNIDLIPTILSLLGIDRGDLPGINVLDKNELNDQKVIFAEAYNHDIINTEKPAESILYKVAVEKKWKLMVPNTNMITKEATSKKENIQGFYSNKVQLFDLESDPDELQNVADQNPQVVTRLTKAIDNWWKPNS